MPAAIRSSHNWDGPPSSHLPHQLAFLRGLGSEIFGKSEGVEGHWPPQDLLAAGGREREGGGEGNASGPHTHSRTQPHRGRTKTKRGRRIQAPPKHDNTMNNGAAANAVAARVAPAPRLNRAARRALARVHRRCVVHASANHRRGIDARRAGAQDAGARVILDPRIL